MSHLLQMRGLKHRHKPHYQRTNQSHLLQMRGLKPSTDISRTNTTVASFTDAWIETSENIGVT